jgi:hypothetical protein
MSDSEWNKFQEMGGADWLRKIMRTRPSTYYQVFQRPDFFLSSTNKKKQ